MTRPRAACRRRAVVMVLSLASAVGMAACSTSSSSAGRPSAAGGGTPSSGRVVDVVAAENFWGSIAAQVGGIHAHVVSIITNPNTDPHSYKPTAADARVLAAAQLVIENGIGYDPWRRGADADGTSVVTLDVGTLLDVPDGSNPHRWYNPSDVQAVISRMVVDYHPTDHGLHVGGVVPAVWVRAVRHVGQHARGGARPRWQPLRPRSYPMPFSITSWAAPRPGVGRRRLVRMRVGIGIGDDTHNVCMDPTHLGHDTPPEVLGRGHVARRRRHSPGSGGQPAGRRRARRAGGHSYG